MKVVNLRLTNLDPSRPYQPIVDSLCIVQGVLIFTIDSENYREDVALQMYEVRKWARTRSLPLQHLDKHENLIRDMDARTIKTVTYCHRFVLVKDRIYDTLPR